jgi:uncharacterized membrane protein SpoIIM required for sporulation
LCARYGLLGELAAFVAGHGALEVSAMMLAASGGLILGDALVRPGPYRRLDALRVRARQGAALAVGALPFLAAAGLIEGVVSTSEVGVMVRYLLGGCSAVLMYVYLLSAGRGPHPAGSRTTEDPWTCC